MAEPKPDQEPSMEEILASIRRIISDDNAPEEAEPALEEVITEEEEVYDLTEVVEEEPEDEAAIDEKSIEARESDGVGEEVVLEQAQAAVLAAVEQSDLMSADTAVQATNQLGELASVVAANEVGTLIGQANLTIEDLVKEVMRPMVREWLDANLPSLGERAVNREVERLSSRAEEE